MHCKKCNITFRQYTFQFCPYCGDQMVPKSETAVKKRKSLASRGKRTLNGWCDDIEAFVSDREFVNQYEYTARPVSSVYIEADEINIW